MGTLGTDMNTKKQITIKRYRPFWHVLDADWDESWDDFKKATAIITGGDNPSHIDACVDGDLLSVKLVLNRIQVYAEEKELVTDVDIIKNKFDSVKVRAELLTSLSAISKKEVFLNDCGKEMEKLLLLMFELGTQVGAINVQDLAIRGKEDIKKKIRANLKSAEKRQPKADSRKQAYLKLFDQMKTEEYKITYDGLRNFLKAQNEKIFNTEVDGCEKIWLHENGIYDSQNNKKAISQSTISRYIKGLD